MVIRPLDDHTYCCVYLVGGFGESFTVNVFSNVLVLAEL